MQHIPEKTSSALAYLALGAAIGAAFGHALPVWWCKSLVLYWLLSLVC